MGRIVSSRSLTTTELFRLAHPILLCVDKPNFEKAAIENGYRQIRLNLMLAWLLAGLELNEIRTEIAEKIRNVLPQRDSVFLTDYEMLFDPRYELDVLRLFVDISRHNKLIVKWYGNVEKEALTYAEQGFADYKRYLINDYNIVVVN